MPDASAESGDSNGHTLYDSTLVAGSFLCFALLYTDVDQTHRMPFSCSKC